MLDCIYDLPQEHWRPKILFAIARGIGTPLSLDDATIRRSFGHFARVLVDLDLKKELRDVIMVERDDFAFLVNVEYEKLQCFVLIVLPLATLILIARE